MEKPAAIFYNEIEDLVELVAHPPELSADDVDRILARGEPRPLEEEGLTTTPVPGTPAHADLTVRGRADQAPPRGATDLDRALPVDGS